MSTQRLGNGQHSLGMLRTHHIQLILEARHTIANHRQYEVPHALHKKDLRVRFVDFRFTRSGETTDRLHTTLKGPHTPSTKDFDRDAYELGMLGGASGRSSRSIDSRFIPYPPKRGKWSGINVCEVTWTFPDSNASQSWYCT